MKKNLNAIITNSILIGLGVLFVCFMAGTYTPTLSGYSMLSICFEEITYYPFMFFVIGTLLALVVAGVVTVLAVLNLLVALNVIKKPELAKTFSKVISRISFAVVVGMILSFIGYYLAVDGEYFGWAIIVEVILAIAIVVVSFYNKIASKIAAKKAAKENKE